MARLVGYFELRASTCGLSFAGMYLAKLRQCVLSERQVLELHEVPHYDRRILSKWPLEVLYELLMAKVPAIVSIFPSESRSGKHYVHGPRTTAIIDEFSPIPMEVFDVKWVEDLPCGQCVYYARLKPLTAEIPVTYTAFRSSLEHAAVEKQEFDDHIRYTLPIEYAQLLEKHKITYGYDDHERPIVVKSKIPSQAIVVHVR